MDKKKRPTPGSYPHVSQEIRLGQHFEGFQSQLSQSWMYEDRAQINTKESILDKIGAMIGTGKESLKKLDYVCRIQNLFPPGASETIQQRQERGNTADPREADELLNIAALTLAGAAHQVELKKHHKLYQKRMDEINNSSIPKFAREPNSSSLITIPGDFLLVARIFKPYSVMSHLTCRSQDLLLRGSGGLSSFRDAIKCECDKFEVFGGGSYYEMKSLQLSSMFYLGNAMYVDAFGEFDPTAFSSTKEFHEQFRNVVVHDMSETLISDLEIRLGYPYVFKHRGECEHNIIFLDARLMMQDDLQELDHYPLEKTYPAPVLRCVVCKTYGAKYMVKDVKIPFMPALLCSACCKAYYGINGNGDPNVPDGNVKMPVDPSFEPRETVENEESIESDQSTDAEQSSGTV